MHVINDDVISMSSTLHAELEMDYSGLVLPGCPSLSSFTGFINSKVSITVNNSNLTDSSHSMQSGNNYYIELRLPNHDNGHLEQAAKIRAAR